MYSVLLQEEPVHAAAAESESFPVPVTVLIDGRAVAFQPDSTSKNYQVEPQSVRLIGSGGGPREFVVTFTLSSESQKEGYTFFNPALKFFQGNSRHAGFRVNVPLGQVSVAVSFFNTLQPGHEGTSDEFSLLLVAPDGTVFVHDPTIVWDPPNG